VRAAQQYLCCIFERELTGRLAATVAYVPNSRSLDSMPAMI